MSNRQKSLVWEYFDATSTTAAGCKLCAKIIKRSNGNTSNMTSHLQHEHRQEYQSMKNNDERKKIETELENQVCRATCFTVTFVCKLLQKKHLM